MRPRGANKDERDQPPSATRGKALLVVEGPESRRYYFDVLEGCGYRVTACSSYQEGMHYLEENTFDFVMVSQGTPNFEGRCVLKLATENNPSLPVLVVARCLDMGCYLEAMQLGAVDYLVEPLTDSEIVRVLENDPPFQSLAA